LTLEQWCDLAKVVASRAVKLDKKEAEKAGEAAKAGDIKASIGFLFELLDPEGIAGLYSVLTGIPAKKLRDNFNMAEFISVIGAMKETGELPEVFSAFTKVVEGW
jgi:inactivated superfamily I helicase